MVEGIVVGLAVAAIVGLAGWGWKRWGRWHPVRRLRNSVSRAYRMRRLRAGKYVTNLSAAEYEAVLENPGIESLHPQVRADVEEAIRDIEAELGKWRVPVDLGPFR